MPPLPATPAHWLLLAAEARALADELTDEQARRTMLLIARGYDALAEHAARVRLLNLPMDAGNVGPSRD
jgi:hypothetical protein